MKWIGARKEFGDVSADDISCWIPNTVKDLTESLIVYDQTNQKVFFFVTDKVLVLFKDILIGGQGISPWSVYKTLDTSEFNANAAKYMYVPGTTNYTVYWGDSTGRIFDMNGTGTGGDAGSLDIQLLRTSRLIDAEVITNWSWRRKVLDGKLQYRRIGECAININVDWADEYNVSTSTLTLKGPPSSDTPAYFGGSIYFSGLVYFNQGFTFAEKISTKAFSPVGKGPGFFISVDSENKVRYEIDHLQLE